MSERNFKPLFSWRSAICESDLAPTTRHVALTLSMHMNERGGSCFPSQETQASETGLAVKTVAEHLKILTEAGWLAKKVIRRGEGRGTRVEYSATNPPLTTGGQTTGGLTTGGYDDDQPPFDGTTTYRQTGCVEDDSEDDKRTTITSSPSAPSFEMVVAERTEPDRFDDFWSRYPKRVSKKAARKAWGAMTEANRASALAVIESHVAMWVAEGRGTATVPHAATWLNGESWDDEVGFVPSRNVRQADTRASRNATVLNGQGSLTEAIANLNGNNGRELSS